MPLPESHLSAPLAAMSAGSAPNGAVPNLRWSALFVGVAIALSGCGSKPTAPPPPAPAVQTLQQHLQDAAQAASAGRKEQARDIYRSAARSYPASKEPWAKLAEDYFDAANYGQAILAAQEVLQRDPADNLANSILAVSGLRVSTTALTNLRQRAGLSVGTRNEAEGLARTLRDVLGERELVPRPSAAVPVDAPGAAPARPRPRPAPASAPAPAAAPRPPAPAPAPAAPDNPFK
jgi:hypothetical protein